MAINVLTETPEAIGAALAPADAARLEELATIYQAEIRNAYEALDIARKGYAEVSAKLDALLAHPNLNK